MDVVIFENTRRLAMKMFYPRSRAIALCAAVAATAMGGLVSAKDVKVKLSGAEETSPVATSASATGIITIKADKSVSGSVKASGVDGTVAHIHVGAPGQ